MGGAVKRVVSVVRCDDYDCEDVCTAVRRSIDLIGGIGAFASPGQTVLVKPNLLAGSPPETCVTTHPAVVYAVAECLRDHGCRVIIGDSPGAGMPYREATLRRAYAASGYDRVAEELGVGLNLDTGHEIVSFPKGQVMKRFSIINPALEADAIAVLSKAKTHNWTRMTGAAKNLFGLIPGLEKPGFHFRFQDEESFSAMLVDLNELMRPRLQIMDAVIGMEGDGPHSGTPRKIGAILASDDYTAMDVATARLIGMDPLEIATIAHAVRRGLVREDLGGITFLGEPLEEFVVDDYRKPSTYRGKGRILRHNSLLRLTRFFGRLYALQPEIRKDVCVGCGRCERACPVDAITMADGRAVIDLRRCIRCYCCHEMCSDHAIRLERSRIGRLIAGLAEGG